MGNILVECTDLIPSVRLGVLGPLTSLSKVGKLDVKFKKTEDIKSCDIEWCDTLVCVRGCWPVSHHIVKSAKAANRFIIYFLDDDILNIPGDVESSKLLSNKLLRQAVVDIISLANVFWCVNSYLGEKYRHIIKGTIICSKVPVPFIEKKTIEEKDQISILYAGSPDHKEVVQEILSPVLRKLAIEYGDKINITFIGANPCLDDIKQVTYYPYLSNYEEYRKLVKQGGFQIGLAPIRTLDFYKCKYYNKYLEYTTIGSIGVYSNSEPYSLVIKDEINGFLCENSIDEWYYAIKKAINDKYLRNDCYENARNHINYDFTDYEVSGVLAESIPELIYYKSPPIASNFRFSYNIKFLYYLNIAQVIWQQNGITSIPYIILKTIKKIFQWIK